MNLKHLFFSNVYKSIPSFGLDISDFSIKIAQLKKHGNGFKLKSINRVPLSEGILEGGKIIDDKRLVAAIKKIISEAKGEKIRTKFAVCSLPEQHAFIKIIRLPKMSPEEIKKAIKWEIEASIPFSLDEVYFDWQIVSPYGLNHIDIFFNAVPRKTVDRYLEVLISAGIEPLAFEVESTATTRSLLKGGVSKKPVLIIENEVGGCNGENRPNCHNLLPVLLT